MKAVGLLKLPFCMKNKSKYFLTIYQIAFYTTNKQQGGSGLGLSIVYNLVTQKLNGKIEVESEEGKGVRFTIAIPLQEDSLNG